MKGIIMNRKYNRKPRIGILVDRPGWAYDIIANKIKEELSDQFNIKIYYVSLKDKLNENDFDLLHVCFWGEKYHTKFNISPQKIVKEISSHRWQYDEIYGKLPPADFKIKYLQDASFWAVTSERLKNILIPYIPSIRHIKNGFDPSTFYPPSNAPTGEISLMWAGNARDPIKGISDILIPAARNYNLYIAKGDIPHHCLAEQYRKNDIIVICSQHEAGPLPLLEGMACGCFPVCCDVGIVPEVIRHKQNGYIVSKRSPEAFREAFQWCDSHLAEIRNNRFQIAHSIKDRMWKKCASTYAVFWNDVLRKIYYPIFRNDDVSPDTNVKKFKEFCQSFYKEDFIQIHAVTLSGYCNVTHQYGGLACEYPHRPPISFWTNDDIRKASSSLQIEDNKELIDFLNNSPDELAFHGSAHLDFSQMSERELRREFFEGLTRMKALFPNKKVSYFVPPFNRANKLVERIANEFHLTTLKVDGVHFEESLQNIKFFQNIQYRYHHHRFYSESKFSCYPLSIQRLQEALSHPVCLDKVSNSYRYKYILNKIIIKIKLKIISKWHNLWSIYKKNNIFPISIRNINKIIDQCSAPQWHKYAFLHLVNRNFTYDLLKWITINIPQDAAIFELGCDCGQNLFVLNRKGYFNLYGIDIDHNSISVAKNINKHVKNKINFSTGDIFTETPPLMFDIIFSLDVIYLQNKYDFNFVIEKFSKFIHKDGFLAFDVIDTAYNSIDKNKYLTSDWDKPEVERRETEYKLRTSFLDIEKAASLHGFEIYLHNFYEDIPQRSLYIIKKVHNII